MWDTPGYSQKRCRYIKRCLDELRTLAGLVPDMRFTQLLAIVGIKPDEQWNEEPWITYEKIVKWKNDYIKSNNVKES